MDARMRPSSLGLWVWLSTAVLENSDMNDFMGPMSYIALHYITLHYATLRYTTLHYIGRAVQREKEGRGETL